jgi:hypothetical protein
MRLPRKEKKRIKRVLRPKLQSWVQGNKIVYMADQINIEGLLAYNDFFKKD